jgi:bacteriocin-like protein
MAKNEDLNMEIETLSDEDLDSVSGGIQINTSGSGTCDTSEGKCTTSPSATCNTSGGTCGT